MAMMESAPTPDVIEAHRLFGDATRRMVDVHWNKLLDMLIDEFPDATKFTTYRGNKKLTIYKVLDDAGIDLLERRDARTMPTECAWCEEAESAVFRAGLGHDPECPFGGDQRGEKVAGEWGSAELDAAARPHLHWLWTLAGDRFQKFLEEEHDITRPYQYVKLVAVLRLRRTYDNNEDFLDILPADNQHGEVMFAATDPGYAGEFDEMGAAPDEWEPV